LDEERVEGAEGTGETQGAAQETEVQEQQGAGQGAEPEITLGEDGGLDIPDSFWDDAPAQGPEKKEEGPEPAWYTPEEFAAAYESGQIDEGKLNPAILDYYKLALGVEQRRRDAAEIQRQAAAQAPQPRPRPQVTWEQVWEAGKMRAAQYLGIKPEEFDEFDERHKAARLMAVNEIRESSQAAARREAQARQAWEGRVAQVARIHSEYRQKEPEIDEIANGFFPAWRQNLTVGQNQAVERILEQGDDAQIRQLYDLVIEGYRAFKNPPKAQGRGAPPPPRVMSAGGAEGEAQGMADAAKLAGMSPEDQASWLMQNKLVV
jgi:hypothetical protein